MPILESMERPPSDPYDLPAPAPETQQIGGPGHLPAPLPTSKRRGPWMLIAGAIGALVLVGGGGLIALQAFTSVSQAPAASMPPDTGAYFSVDLLQLTGEDTTGALVETIRGVLQRLGEDVSDPDDLIAELDAELRASTGFDFSNDIRPWLGRTIGVGVVGGGWDPLDYTSTPEVVVAVEVRNENEARDFLDTVRSSMASEGIMLTRSTYRGVDLLSGNDSGMDLALAVSQGTLLAGTPGGVQRALDAQNGASLADNPRFTEATGLLPESRLFTGWIDGSFYQEVYDDLLTGLDPTVPNPALDAMDGWKGAAFAITVTEAGVALDGTVLFDEGRVPDWYGPQVLGSGSMPTVLPADTLAFVEYGSPAAIWSSVAASLVGLQPGYDAEMESLKAEYGIHPIDDFVAYLDGALGVALIRSNDGLLAAESGYPVGLVGLAGTSSPDPLRATLEQLRRVLSAEGIPVSKVGPHYVYQEGEHEAVAYGVSDTHFMIGTSSSDLARIGAGSSRLAGSPTYVAAVDALPGEDYVVSFYADVAGIAGTFGAEGETRIALEPFTAVVGATHTDGSLYRATVLVLIDYDD